MTGPRFTVELTRSRAGYAACGPLVRICSGAHPVSLVKPAAPALVPDNAHFVFRAELTGRRAGGWVIWRRQIAAGVVPPMIGYSAYVGPAEPL